MNWRLVLLLSIFIAVLCSGWCSEPRFASSGPWGKVRIYELDIYQPARSLELVALPSKETVWRFQKITSFDRLKEFFDHVLSSRDSDILAQLRNELALQEIAGVETRAFPSASFIKSLTVSERTKIYRELAVNRGNPFHEKPVFIDSDSIDDWFAGSGLNPEALDLIKSLSYPVGESLAFSDIPLVLETVSSKKEEIDLIRSLNRRQQLYLKLDIEKGSDIELLKRYWLPGSMTDPYVPVFDSLTRDDMLPVEFDLIEVLPSMVKKRLGEFPSVADGASGVYPDGFWTSLNFFVADPDITDVVEDFRHRLENNYKEISPPYQYGDMMVFADSNSGEALHACIFIADDMAFTKNDRSINEPWMMMDLKYIKSRFSMTHKPLMSGWRLKQR